MAQDPQIVQDLRIVPQISVRISQESMQRGNIMVFIQHNLKDAFIYFVTLESGLRSWRPGKQIQRIVGIKHGTRPDSDGRMGEGERE
jgi:hypothetical protein